MKKVCYPLKVVILVCFSIAFILLAMSWLLLAMKFKA